MFQDREIFTKPRVHVLRMSLAGNNLLVFFIVPSITPP